tara:strand:- start:1058 stop:2734 length:1677 start_codon:yes stop_codon:yes gene_type:complete
MAITNASDLLVYKYTTPAQAQITRILVKSTTPFDQVGTFLLNGHYRSQNTSYEYNKSVTFTANTGTNVLNAIKTLLEGVLYNYSSSPGTVGTIGDYKYFDFTSPVNGEAPDIFIKGNTATPSENAINIEITQDGQDVIYEPVGFSTNASLTLNNDVRDVTSKDSSGFSQLESGQKSFEISTEALVNINADINAEEFVSDLKSGNIFDAKFSERVRNIVPSNIIDNTSTYWSDGAGTSANFVISQADPFGGFTASKIVSTANGDNSVKFEIPNTKLQGFYNHATFYVKAVGSNDEFTIDGGVVFTSKISGPGTVTSVAGGNEQNITGLSTTEWTRIYVRHSGASPTSGTSADFTLNIFPSIKGGITSGEELLISSMQVEQNLVRQNGYTSYQNPVDVKCYQGDVAVTNVSIDAGVEENTTYSCTLTGTGQLFINGLSNELLTNTQFYSSTGWSGTGSINTTNGTFTFSGSSSVNLLAKTSSGTTLAIQTSKEFELTYTVSAYTSGLLEIQQTGANIEIPASAGTHTIRYTNDLAFFRIQNTAISTNITLTSVSLKLVRP